MKTTIENNGNTEHKEIESLVELGKLLAGEDYAGKVKVILEGNNCKTTIEKEPNGIFTGKLEKYGSE